jgi:hypothetical protein
MGIQIGNSRAGCPDPESILTIVVMDSGLVPSGRALRGPLSRPGMTEKE